MFRVPAIALVQLDLRVVLFAVLIAAGAAFASMQIVVRARECAGLRRATWVLLAGASTAAGMWSTYFLAVRAYAWDFATTYDPWMVATTLAVAVIITTTGYALAAPKERWQAAASGILIGLGVVVTNDMGMRALDVPATLFRGQSLTILMNTLTLALCCVAMVVHRERQRRWAFWVAPGLLASAICGLHFAAVGTLVVTPDAALAGSAADINGTTLTIVVACTTGLILSAAHLATLLAAQSSRETELELRRQNNELRQREQELRAQNVRFELALASLPHGFLVADADRRVVACNKPFADMYGVPPELTRPGTLIKDVVEHRIANGIFTASEADAFRQEALGPVVRATSKTRYLSGGRYVLVTRRPTPEGGWIAVHEDITERRRLQDTERETKEILAAVFDAVPAAIICVAPDRRVLFWSRGAQHIFGYTAEEAVGQPYKLVPPDAKAASDALFQREIAGEILRDVRVSLRRKDGSLVDICFSCAPMRDRDGDVRGVVYAIDDLTEWEKLAGRLEAQNQLLEQREEKLKTQNEQLDMALTNMADGLAMFDAQECLVLANGRYYELFDLTPEEAPPGTAFSSIVELRMAKGFYAGLPKEDVLQGLRDRIKGTNPVDLHIRPDDGRILTSSVQARADGGWVVTLHDITKQEQLKKQLQEQNEQRDAAMNNMWQGLAMFDGAHRLVVCNKLYGEMYGLTPEQTKPGTTIGEVLKYRLATGLYQPNDLPRVSQEPGHLVTVTNRLTDGRVMHVAYRRMPNGGLVITHEDITARENLNAQLDQQHQLLKAQEEKLKSQNLQLDAALNNMAQGLAMIDTDQRIVIANHRYAELYNLPPEMVKPGTHVRDIVERCMANGDIQGKSLDEVMHATLELIRTDGSQITTRLRDGRYIFSSSRQMANGFVVTTHEDITDQRRSKAKIVHMAMHDALTGLPNRVLFNERLVQALTRAKRGEIVATHLLDLDHFKNVNDTLGHSTGDKLLQAVTERLCKLMRETDTIARMGGDEFAILQPALPQAADAGVLARRVIDAVSEPYDIDGHQVVIGTSVGIAVGPADGDVPDQLMRNADLALYRAKGDGRGAFRFFEPGMDAKMQERRVMETDLRKALVGGEFELFYQPVVNLESNKINGFEALIRWRHPARGLISPAQFIPLAEEIGFIIPLGEWAIRQACATAARWPDKVKIAVNLSPVQFRSTGLVQTVVSALAASGLQPERLELEITETTLLQDSEATLGMLYRLREIGVGIAMDDFGTGYSSLSYLQSFPFDRIKIDRSFIKDIGDGVGSLNIVRAVAAMAKGLGMETTAEGVETELQRKMVALEGCTEMQGFLFSKPLPANEIEQLYYPNLASAPAEPAPDAAQTPVIAARAIAR